MFLLGEKETTPTKDTLKKNLDYLKDKKYPLVFTLLAAGLIGFFVDLKTQLNKASKKIKELIAKQLMKKLKSELQNQLLKAGDAVVQTVKRYLLHIAIIIVLAAIIYYKV